MPDLVEVAVRVLSPEGDDQEDLEQLTQLLRQDLLETDVAAVDLVTAQESPAGAKGLAAVAGALAVQVRTFTALRQMVSAVRAWAGRTGRSCKVCLDGDCIEVTGVTPELQEQLVNAWLARHAAAP
ncbi:hypothetical protein [Streptomyces bicolor]|uniref:hypothetical protein n=1 Tax=Streptomyces bicolor TaxID=66874 RepID=UPI000AD851B3|nr:hypothetical protein [Streptomyces bicolor]